MKEYKWEQCRKDAGMETMQKIDGRETDGESVAFKFFQKYQIILFLTCFFVCVYNKIYTLYLVELLTVFYSFFDACTYRYKNLFCLLKYRYTRPSEFLHQFYPRWIVNRC